MLRLSRGDALEIAVYARRYWNRHPDGLEFIAGHRYELSVDRDSVTDWRDSSIESGPEGETNPRAWWFKPFEGVRRKPDAPWYALVGDITGTPGQRFVIGFGTTVEATTTGEFRCFANDIPGFYLNNHGTLTLRVKRL